MKKTKRNRTHKETQLRRVISKQAEEIKYLRAMLEYKVNEEYNAMQQAAFDLAAKNMYIETHAPEYRIRASQIDIQETLKLTQHDQHTRKNTTFILAHRRAA